MAKKPTKNSGNYLLKALGLGLVILLLMIPLSMIRGLVNERRETASEAEAKIMQSWGEELAQAGPVLSIPGVRTITTRTQSEKEGEKISTHYENFTLVVMPRELNIKTDFQTEVRSYGIFSVPLFQGQLQLDGVFDSRQAIASIASNERLSLDKAQLGILLSSQKGIRKINNASWNNRQMFFQPLSSSGISAALPPLTEHRSYFDINIDIQGGQSVRILPVAQDTQAIINSDWSSPSFQGAFLPVSRDVTDESFTAQWNISYLSRGIPLFWKINKALDAVELDDVLESYESSLFGVDFFRQIDTYALNTRAVKYSILFLVVPFLALFLMEIFSRQRIHPVPYLLSGIGNIVFYLLLLSFSEQIAFAGAYTISALSVAVMMTLYSRTLLGTWANSWYMGLVMALSYIFLYAVLNAESYALLIGSIGAFLVTALIMYLTRKLDWYGK